MFPFASFPYRVLNRGLKLVNVLFGHMEEILIAVFLFVFLSSTTAQDIPEKYVAYKSPQAINVDGVDDELSWQNAPWSRDFIDIEGQKDPEYTTQMKMIWDEQYLYFFAKMEEPNVWGTLKQRDTVIFYNNDFEIFIDPDGDTHNYMEFEMNVLNTVWDLFLTKPYRNSGRVLDSWDISGLKTAIQVQGSLNKFDDTDKGWSVEIAMPWSVLTEANSKNGIPVNEFWRINFSRVNWQFELNNGHYSRKKNLDGNFLPEYNWVWSPQGVINMHEPEHWGYVYFSDRGVGDTINFEIPKDEYIKWHLYSLYRKLLKSGDNFKSAEKEIILDKTVLFYQPIRVKVDQHQSGWNIWTISPFTNKKMIIKNDGLFLSYEK